VVYRIEADASMERTTHEVSLDLPSIIVGLRAPRKLLSTFTAIEHPPEWVY
jgi:hypothetical protein